MTPPDRAARHLDAEARHLVAASWDADDVLAAAEAAYARADPPPALASPAARVRAAWWSDPADPRPERLVTYPLWFLWALLVHAATGVLTTGVIATGAGILAFAGWVVVDRQLGVPLASAAAVCVGALAAAGTVPTLRRSFSDMLDRFPW